ncbi:MAG: GAF domain-containing protein, partial [Anaerolineae bacterium]
MKDELNNRQSLDQATLADHQLAEIMRELARIISATQSHREILRQSLQQLKRVLDFDSASIYLLPWRGQNEFVAGIGYTDEAATTQEAEALLTDSPIIRRIVETQAPILSGDVRTLEGWIWVKGAEHVCSFMGVPLVTNQQAIGVLMLDNSCCNQYSQDDLGIVVPLAQLIAVSVEKARLFEEAQHQLLLANTLQQVGALLTTSLSLEEVYELIFDLLAQVVSYESVTIQVLAADGQTLEMAAARGFPDVEQTAVFVSSLSHFTLAKFEHDRRWQVIYDTGKYPLWRALPGEMAPIRSWIGAKLLVKDRLIGILNVDHSQANHFNEVDGETVAAFANQAAVAIENARLYEETRWRASKLEILHQVAVQTSDVVDVDQLFAQTTGLIVRYVHPRSFGFVLVEGENGRLSLHPSYYGLNPTLSKMLLSDTGIVQDVIRTESPRIVADTGLTEADFGQMVRPTRSQIAMPVMVDGRVYAVMCAGSSYTNAFSENDNQFLGTLAGQVATVVERAQLYAALQHHADELSREVAQRTAELQLERDRTLAILESAGEGIFLTDLAGKILYANPAIVRQSGYTRLELLGQTPRILQSDQTPRSLFNDMWRTLEAGHSWQGELVNLRKDGQPYDVAMTIVPLQDVDGQVVNYVSVQSDISRLKEVERLKTKFVSNVSHELRTPLTNITTYLKLLEKGREERRGDYLAVLNLETQRLTRLIQDLLDLSQLETDPISDTAVSTDLVSHAQTHFQTFLAQAKAKKIRFEITATIDSLLINIDPRHLGQLLTNLIGNAFAYTPEGGSVSVQIGLDEGRAMAYVQVIDSGVGIPPEDMPRLFDRFFRGWAAQDKNIPGTGLGLAICREITERWGGDITVDSQVGGGAA